MIFHQILLDFYPQDIKDFINCFARNHSRISVKIL